LGRCSKAPGWCPWNVQYELHDIGWSLLDKLHVKILGNWVIFTLIYIYMFQAIFSHILGEMISLSVCRVSISTHPDFILSMSSWSTRSSTSCLENGCYHTASYGDNSRSFTIIPVTEKDGFGHYNPSRIWLSWYPICSMYIWKYMEYLPTFNP
jgi:hypothetical protein